MATSVTSGTYNVSSGVTETGDYVAQTGLISVSEGGEVSLHALSYTDSGGSGTLTVTDGTTTAQLHLIGAYTVGSFKTSVDGTGGTIITDPPVSNGAALAPH